MDDLKTPADDAAAAEEFVHLFGRGIGCDIEIFGFDAEQQIPDRAADHISLKPRPFQTAYDVFGGKAQHFGTDVVSFGRNDRFTFRFFTAPTGSAASYSTIFSA